MKNLTRLVFTRPTYFIALGFGSGLAPVAPGTAATLLAVLFYFFLIPLSSISYAVVVCGAFILGVWVCGSVAKELGQEDPSQIVWDEMVGYWITMMGLIPHPIEIVLGVILFRFFDILKPWPIRFFEKKFRGGFGIMIDDVIAGIFSCIILHLLEVWVL